MSSKTKKAQVVIVAIDQASHSFFFLLLRTNKSRGSFWQNVTGKLEENETFEEGGLREAMEETGLKVESVVDLLDLGLKYDFTDQRERKVHEESFLLIIDSKWNVVIDPHEHDDHKWVGVNEIHPEIVKHQSNYETLLKSQQLLKHWGA